MQSRPPFPPGSACWELVNQNGQHVSFSVKRMAARCTQPFLPDPFSTGRTHLNKANSKNFLDLEFRRHCHIIPGLVDCNKFIFPFILKTVFQSSFEMFTKPHLTARCLYKTHLIASLKHFLHEVFAAASPRSGPNWHLAGYLTYVCQYSQ